MKDVARKAGVSTQTVSRVINKRPYVSEQVAQKVWQSIEALKYSPQESARCLVGLRNRTGLRTGNIGFILYPTYNKYSHPVPSELMEELDKILHENNMHCCFHLTLKELEDERLFRKMINPSLIDGCIAVGLTNQNKEQINRIRQYVKPMVLLGVIDEDYVTCIWPDGLQSGYLATRHCLQHGHRQIACITGYKEYSSSNARFMGYCQALSEAGIPFNPELVREGKYVFEATRLAVRELLKSKPAPTAIFTVSDPMAISAYYAIMETGLRIPDDISIVSVDNTKAAIDLFPPLTTVGADRHELVRTAVSALLEEIQGKRNPGDKILMPVKVFERNSCADYRAG